MWSDDDDDGERGDMYGDGSEEDEYEGVGSSPRKAKRSKTGEEKAEEEYRADGFVVPDESDEDGDSPAHRRKRARGGSDAEDDLERMEASLEKQAAAEKKGQPKKAKKAAARDEDESEEEAGAMDVESEEEEEEFKVRRVTSKRIALENEDEDEYE